jgi:hypothetical protein
VTLDQTILAMPSSQNRRSMRGKVIEDRQAPKEKEKWQQFCQMIADRFTQANANEAVELCS